MVSKQDIVDEIQRCADDPEYFIKTYVNIEHPIKGIIPFNLYKFQSRILKDMIGEKQSIQNLMIILNPIYHIWIRIMGL